MKKEEIHAYFEGAKWRLIKGYLRAPPAVPEPARLQPQPAAGGAAPGRQAGLRVPVHREPGRAGQVLRLPRQPQGSAQVS